MRRSTVLLGIFLFFSFAAVLPVAAESLSTVNVSNQEVTLSATAGVEQVRYFSLDSPKRLVVDLYGVAPGAHALDIPLSAGFSALRTGTLENRTRFVFDVAGDQFPTFNVATGSQSAVVTWQPAAATTFSALSEPAPQGSAKVDAINFTNVDGRSRLLMTISGQAQATDPVRDGNRVQFSLPDTTLPRALRREFDTFAFPSAIHSATPYLVNAGGRPEVRVVVLLKGDVTYQLQRVADGYEFIVSDGIYAQTSPVVSGQTAVPVSSDISPQTSSSLQQVSSSSAPSTSLSERRQAEKVYTGEKTSLVFDNADVRDILRLIAEISDLNIIASEEVSGNITLRLIDVPWDQALDLVLDVSGLGMIQQGNVVRVLPKNTIQTMREAEMSAARTEEQLETLVTEVITVSYADITSVVEPIEKILSERGTLTPDLRNKLLIVNDIPARIERARELISILDTPERQVMIEARIIQVNSNYSRNLGVNWGIQSQSSAVNPGAQQITNLGGNFQVPTVEPAFGALSAASAGLGSQIRIGRTNIDNLILDLQLSALETDNKLKIISAPRTTTLNGQKSIIKQGKEIPFERTDSEGVRTIEWKEAVLMLEVTPVINPDNSIILDIIVSNDRRESFEEGDGLDIKRAETKALITDGETTVIGGIYIESTEGGDSGVPGLMRIPGLGHLFKSKSESTIKDELLIFITPRIIRDM
ncbi:type IV pilus secretin family protein [Pelovirga terrestris]|uniref:Type IV pilus secretin PilQ n=1 Tax=Pelovirga terrestris TaxID=2771352 RepID=A0A8J6UKH6_9BACT|nr:type IV pilus secretin family protein [Pelovirga terrestris]MBD1399422.1 type IV pilus secretin PilQ [Pelovirga terrestris]